MAPTRPAKITASRPVRVDGLADGVGHRGLEDQERDEVEQRGPDDRHPRGQDPGRTTVAIELAASWKPLVKANTSASRAMAMTEREGQVGHA